MAGLLYKWFPALLAARVCRCDVRAAHALRNDSLVMRIRQFIMNLAHAEKRFWTLSPQLPPANAHTHTHAPTQKNTYTCRLQTKLCLDFLTSQTQLPARLSKTDAPIALRVFVVDCLGGRLPGGLQSLTPVAPWSVEVDNHWQQRQQHVGMFITQQGGRVKLIGTMGGWMNE